MSDVMLFGVLKMPYEMAMESELSRIQFYQRVQQLVARVEAQQPLPAQEPVGKVVEAVEGAFRCEFTAPLPAGTKLYTTPPQREWVGLTDGEAGECHSPNYVQTVARIEAKLKEKNNG